MEREILIENPTNVCLCCHLSRYSAQTCVKVEGTQDVGQSISTKNQKESIHEVAPDIFGPNFKGDANIGPIFEGDTDVSSFPVSYGS